MSELNVHAVLKSKWMIPAHRSHQFGAVMSISYPLQTDCFRSSGRTISRAGTRFKKKENFLQWRHKTNEKTNPAFPEASREQMTQLRISLEKQT